MAPPVHRIGMGAGAIVFDGANRVLLVRQNYGKRRYTLPGGEVDPGEAPHAAALRELAEETGSSGVVMHLVSAYWLRRADIAVPYALFGFRCELTNASTPGVVNRAEISEVGWFDPENLPQPFTEATPLLIADAVRGVRGFFGEASA